MALKSQFNDSTVAEVKHPIAKLSPIQPRIVTVDPPGNHEIDPGNGFDGVVSLSISIPGLGSFLCTGTLLPTGRHILTAAHCLTDDNSNFINGTTTTATFQLSSGNVDISSSNIFIHPDYDDFSNDIAIIELSSEAPAEAERFDIYRDSDEVGQVFDKVGYGRYGQGSATNSSNEVKRGGKNKIDDLGDVFSEVMSVPPGTQLAYDFDNGNAANDAFGFFYGTNDLGLGNDEVNTAQGDSGGPAFINGKIAGVTSYGLSLTNSDGSTSDVDSSLNSSFGEFSVDTRVSAYADWIDRIIECFLTGTHILTDAGEIPVEELKIGDLVQTAEGKFEPIKWIGRQTVEPSQVKNPLHNYPVLVKAGALGPNIPSRDLYLSPNHSLLVDGLLINAGALVNDVSILKTEPTETFVYYHIELDKHALLVAEGTHAESYLPQKEDRLGYDNGAEYSELYPHDSGILLWPLNYPRVSSRVKVPRFVKKRLMAVAKALCGELAA